MSQITKLALVASLKNLLAKKSLDKITVTDIADDCNVNRQTFYYHFSDIYDLMDWALINEAKTVLDGKMTYDTWQEGFIRAFDAVEDNKVLIVNAYHSINRYQVERFLYDIIFKLLKKAIDDIATDEGLNVGEDNKIFMADFYKYGFVGLMLDWIKFGMKEKPEDIVGRLDTLIHGNFSEALKRYPQV